MSGVEDAYYSYDDLDRLLCDSAASGSCPTSGSDLKSNLTAGYTASGERIEFIHRDPIVGTDTLQRDARLRDRSGTDQIETITRDGDFETTYGWDAPCANAA